MAEQGQARTRMVAPVIPRPAAAATALTPKEIFGILHRHIPLMVFMTIVGFIVGGTAWYLLLRYAPKYTAETYLEVLPPVEKDPTTIVAALVGQDIQYGHRLEITSLIKQQRTLQKLLELDTIQATKWFKQFGKAKHQSIPKAYKKLKKRLGVYALRDAGFVKISMTCGDRDEAAHIVNTLVDSFFSSYGITKRREVENELIQLEGRRDLVQRDLDNAESGLTDARKSFTGFEQSAYVRSTAQIKLESLEIEQNELSLEMGQLQAVIGILKKLTIGPIKDQVENLIETDPTVALLTQQVALQNAALAGLLARLGEKHTDVRRTRQLLGETREELRKRRAVIAEQVRRANLEMANDQYFALQQKSGQLEKLRQVAAAEKRNFDLARAEYGKVLSIRDERREMLNIIKEQIDKLRIVRDDPTTPKVRKVAPAPPPLRVSSPMWHFYFPGGTTLGFLFGVGLAFLIELLNDLVRTPRDVSRYLHIPLLGVIPHAAEDMEVQGIDLCHVVRQAPYSVISESYRRLRTNLKLSGSAESLKALLISSGMAGDGKTTVAANLATTLVAGNKRVLLIDANFWRPSLHTTFPKTAAEGEPNEQSAFGLSEVLVGRCGHDEAVRPSGIEGLDIIDSGQLPSNPAELLGGVQMQQLVKQQRESYDYVIIDGPPVLLVSASKMLARVVDGTVLVFNAGATRRGAAQRTIRELREVNTTIVGCVLFAVQAMKGGYFREQFRSYRKYQKLQLAHSV